MSSQSIRLKQMRSGAIVAACFLLTTAWVSCGSSHPDKRTAPPSGSATPQTAKTEPPVSDAEDQRPVIVTFGDSLTQGVSGKSYPAFLQDLLDQNGHSYRVDNQGVSGDTTTDGLARIENVIAAEACLGRSGIRR